jgi:hypothetical protein
MSSSALSQLVDDTAKRCRSAPALLGREVAHRGPILMLTSMDFGSPLSWPPDWRDLCLRRPWCRRSGSAIGRGSSSSDPSRTAGLDPDQLPSEVERWPVRLHAFEQRRAVPARNPGDRLRTLERVPVDPLPRHASATKRSHHLPFREDGGLACGPIQDRELDVRHASLHPSHELLGLLERVGTCAPATRNVAPGCMRRARPPPAAAQWSAKTDTKCSISLAVGIAPPSCSHRVLAPWASTMIYHLWMMYQCRPRAA